METAAVTLTGPGVIERTVSGMGYELVDVERCAAGLLRVTIDRLAGGACAGESGAAVTLDDCEAVTRQLQYALEVDGMDYARLEVSSPGLYRPLRTPAQFARFIGEPVLLTLKLPFEGRKKYAGLLRAVTPEGDAPTGLELVLNDEWLAKPGPAKPAPKGKKAATAPEAVMAVQFDEIREARLVPVVSFKGRARAAAAPSNESEETEGA